MAERESLYLWSTTALTNGAVDPNINYAENQLPSTVNNSARAAMAAHARNLKDINGSITTGGSANAYTMTINGTQAAYATGQVYGFKASFTNTGSSTLNVTNADATALGAKSIRMGTGNGVTTLGAGVIQQDSHYLVRYDTALAGGAGGFLLLNPTVFTNTTGSATDNAAARFDGTDGLRVQTSALIIADTTAALSRSGNGGIAVQGTNTNDSASAGDKGEYIESVIVTGSAISPTTGTAANITSISLTAGDWDVHAIANYKGGTTTTVGFAFASISTTSATLDTSPGRYFAAPMSGTASTLFAGGNEFAIAIPGHRVSLSSTTTVYLVTQHSYATSTMSAYGILAARRVR